MKTLLAVLSLALVFLSNAPQAVAADWDAEYGRLLKKYVTPSGVKYAAWKASAEDVAALKSVTDAIASAPNPGSGKAALPFYINAYNAWILQEVVSKYPIKTIKDPLFTFFTSKRITVAGEKMSFNHLEKEVIRKLNEPRIHFALNCASRSCPPLASTPFDGAQLDSQLTRLTRAFCNSANGAKIAGKSAKVSMIFDWYKDDFGGDSAGFINKYRTEPIPAGAKLEFAPYDWSLNEAK